MVCGGADMVTLASCKSTGKSDVLSSQGADS